MRNLSFASRGRPAAGALVALLGASSIHLAATPARAAPPDPTEPGITRTLTESAAAWSGNDLGGFMEGYENSPQTTYVSGQRLVRGFGAIKAMYASRFGGQTSLGQLSFALDDARSLGPGFALAIGHYRLMRAGRPAPAIGIFTLVFHHTPAVWKIVSDHTSS